MRSQNKLQLFFGIVLIVIIGTRSDKDLQKIAYFIDMDGFNVNGKFQAKEMGIFNLATEEVALFRFKLPVPYDELSDKDRSDANRVTRSVHGIAYENSACDLPSSHLDTLLDWLVQRSNENQLYIAYKGGSYERSALRRANAHYTCDIEKYGAPKFNALYGEEPYASHVSTFGVFQSSDTCDNCSHNSTSENPVHCSATEVKYFCAWIILNFGPFNADPIPDEILEPYPTL